MVNTINSWNLLIKPEEKKETKEPNAKRETYGRVNEVVGQVRNIFKHVTQRTFNDLGLDVVPCRGHGRGGLENWNEQR